MPWQCRLVFPLVSMERGLQKKQNTALFLVATYVAADTHSVEISLVFWHVNIETQCQTIMFSENLHLISKSRANLNVACFLITLKLLYCKTFDGLYVQAREHVSE